MLLHSSILILIIIHVLFLDNWQILIQSTHNINFVILKIL